MAQACGDLGIKTVAIIAGYINKEPPEEFYRYMDAANVDLKGFTERFYNKICAGQLQPVLETLEYLKHQTQVWFEITMLLIPGENDSETEIEELTQWVVERLGPDVPIHFTAFHPDWKMLDKPPTPPATLRSARDIAVKNGLRYAYTGNVHDEEGDSAYCHNCGEKLIGRSITQRRWWRSWLRMTRVMLRGTRWSSTGGSLRFRRKCRPKISGSFPPA